QGAFSIFFYTKKMLAKFTNIKKYRAKVYEDSSSVSFLFLICEEKKRTVQELSCAVLKGGDFKVK
ncbi:hypothetical protein ABQE22_12320, partial [Enterococcus durans]|uniref:hypothetical protein n=1 Tax=Enterococcus durans TaxID=53345 RepID=UPI0032E4A247